MSAKKRFSSAFASFQEWSTATTASQAYKERIREAVLRHPGVTLNQARGHPGPRESGLVKMEPKAISRLPIEARTPKQERDLRLSREVYSEMKTRHLPLEAAARARGIAPAKVLKTLDAFKSEDGRWTPKTYYVSPTQIRVLTEGRDRVLNVPDSRHRQLISRHHNTIRAYLETGDQRQLRPFQGDRVRDAQGRWWTLETDPRAIHDILERREDEERYSVYRERSG